MKGIQVLELLPNPISCTYRGGSRLARFRGIVPGHLCPEDWLASTTARLGERLLGHSVMPDDRTLAEHLEGESAYWLGSEHVAALGSNPGMLVKILDPEERLPVHTHPDRDFACAHLSSKFGKAEAWLILEALPGASVYLGFSRTLSRGALRSLIDGQDAEQLLSVLNKIPVRRGDVVFVPGGVPHAMDAGLLVAEIEEPTDLAVVFEYERFRLSPQAACMNLGWERALSGVRLEALEGKALARLIDRVDLDGERPGRQRLVPDAASFFRVDVIRCTANYRSMEPGYAVALVVAGRVDLRSESNATMDLSAGKAALIPHGAGSVHLDGDGTVLWLRPPQGAPAGRAED